MKMTLAALFGCAPLGLVLFWRLPARQAMLATVFGCWLFLPVASYDLPGLPPYDKAAATAVSVLLGSLVFDWRRWGTLRLGWVDLPVGVLCGVALASSLWNGTGPYDGLSALLHEWLLWGLPYLLGRVYFPDWGSLRDLTRGIVAGALCYVPFCLYEIVMGQQLHWLLYGFHQMPVHMSLRFGGYRPVVFLQAGLGVALWLAVGATVAVWTWRGGLLERLWRLKGVVVVIAIGATAVLAKSVNGWVLLGVGLLLPWAVTRWKTVLPVALLLTPLPVYLAARASGAWDGKDLVRLLEKVHAARAQSVEYRFDNENVIAGNARTGVLLGLGKGPRPYQTGTAEKAVPDSQWIITFGQYGLIGLLALYGTLLLPVGLFCLRVTPEQWAKGAGSAGAALAVLLVLVAIDNLFNAMVHPAYAMAAGALSASLRTGPVRQKA